MTHSIQSIFSQSISLQQQLFADETLHDEIQQIVKLLVRTFQNGSKVLFCGNGGSAADAQHLSTELSGRFYLERAPLFAEALHTNSSFLTAVANDYGYEMVFARAIQAKGKAGDVLFALSTSGNSPNILKAVEIAEKLELKVVGMCGLGGQLMKHCDYLIQIPSSETPRIQEGHILVGHIICQLVEATLFGKNV